MRTYLGKSYLHKCLIGIFAIESTHLDVIINSKVRWAFGCRRDKHTWYLSAQKFDTTNHAKLGFLIQKNINNTLVLDILTPCCKIWHLHRRWCRWQISSLMMRSYLVSLTILNVVVVSGWKLARQDGNGKLDYDEFVKMMLQYWLKPFLTGTSVFNVRFESNCVLLSSYQGWDLGWSQVNISLLLLHLFNKVSLQCLQF